jgi:hypothetical protein
MKGHRGRRQQVRRWVGRPDPPTTTQRTPAEQAFHDALGPAAAGTTPLAWQVWQLVVRWANGADTVSVSRARLAAALTTAGRAPSSKALKQAVHQLADANLLPGAVVPDAAGQIVAWQIRIASKPAPAARPAASSPRPMRPEVDDTDFPTRDEPPRRAWDPAGEVNRRPTLFDRAADESGMPEQRRRVWRVLWNGIVEQLRDGPAEVDHAAVVDRACDRLRMTIPDESSARVLAWAAEHGLARRAGGRRYRLTRPTGTHQGPTVSRGAPHA